MRVVSWMRRITPAASLCVLLCSTTTTIIIRAADNDVDNDTTGWEHDNKKEEYVCKQDKNEVFRWASSGGGFRAMMASAAFANVFRQAGLIIQAAADSSDDDEKSSSSSSSLFSSISTQSGASWFSTQFFYSEKFFTKTALSTPSELYDFVWDWMNVFQGLTMEPNPECILLDLFDDIDIPGSFDQYADYCNLLTDYGGDWALFIRDLFNVASANYGDPDISSRLMSPELRVDAMSQTDLYIQTSLAANSRVRRSKTTENLSSLWQDQVVYIGSDKGLKMYSIPLCVQWSVTNEYATYYSNAPSSGTFPAGAQVHQDDIRKYFFFSDWERFFLFPAAPTGTARTKISMPVTSTLTGDFAIPFAGMVPNLAQIAAASSAAAGPLSPAVPSILAQAASVYRYRISQYLNTSQALLAETALHSVIDSIYQSPVLDDLAVCSQWPESCGETDGRFIDGAFTDSITAALNIGQYQTKQGGDLSKTIKLVLTLHNTPGESPAVFLAYFSTTFNQGVKPGGFLWPLNFTFPLPVSSYQIFSEYLDMDILERQTETFDGINVTSFTTTATTINNPAFNTIAGQRVEILFLRLNMAISTVIIGKTEAEKWQGALAEMAESIAGSSQLVDHVRKFFCTQE